MSLSDDYRAIHDSAAMGALQPRRQIAVAGRDRATYLQGLLTNDITALQAGSGCYATWLTPQGRLVTDLHVLESGDLILLDVPEARHVATLEQLDRFLFSEDVQLASLCATRDRRRARVVQRRPDRRVDSRSGSRSRHRTRRQSHRPRRVA